MYMSFIFFFFFFNDTATTEIYTLSLHDALPISLHHSGGPARRTGRHDDDLRPARRGWGRGGPRLRPGPDRPQTRSLRGPRRSVPRRAPAGRADSGRALLRRRDPGARLLMGR